MMLQAAAGAGGAAAASLPNHLCAAFPPTRSLSQGKPASQSSSCCAPYGAASLAVDGNTNQDYNSGSCAHTSNDVTGPWW